MGNDHSRHATKRLMDIIGSFIGIVFFLPFLPFVVFIIQLDSPGPAIIRIKRVSQGKIFGAYKFRTMAKDAHLLRESLASFNERRDGPFFKIKNDPRVTKVGRWLRKFHVDEIPQLLNVLRDELSLVGPRPHEPQEVAHYPGEYKHLILSKGGLTGLSQVSGASNLPFLKELEFDRYYLKNQSLLLDLKIIAKTFYLVVFKHEGV